MPSLTVDLLLCVILLGGAYICFGQFNQSAAKPGKKKKRSKASKKATAPQSIPSAGTRKAEDASSNASVAEKQAAARPAPSKGESVGKQAKGRANGSEKQTSQTSTSSTRQEPPPNDSDDEDFPALTSSYAARASQGASSNGNGNHVQKPLAERRVKALPKTAVDDMVEKSDALQGQKVFSRTMRIVKPEPDKPLLPDEDDDNTYANNNREDTREAAWQSVPVSNKKSSTIRISSSPSIHSSTSQAASGRSIPGLPELTKKQRQNARKAAEAKAAKEQAEQDRLQRLAQHKRALENEKMNEQYKQKIKQQTPYVQKSKREETGGGMQAKVYDGQLIWE